MTNMQSVLGSPYNREAYMDLLHDQFNVDQLRKPIQLGGNGDGVENLEQLGLIHVSDEKRLPIFEAHIRPETQLHRNRVGLRNVVAKKINQREEGALAVYLNERDKDQWRLSLVAIEHRFDEDGNLIANETDSRRYTYLLGKDAKIRTATEQLTKLNKESSLEDFKNAFSVEALNKEFYTKLHKWYDSAKGEVFFPNDEKKIDDDGHISLSLIRLLTRFLFVWFIKEKGMVDSDLFDIRKLQEIISWNKPSSFYKAILQNLFFATLNCPIQDRVFRTTNGYGNGIHDSLGSNLYQYQDYFQGDTSSIINLFTKTPFLNGGLFECLDKAQREEQNGSTGKVVRLDCFSDSRDNPIKVPNELFFSDDSNQPGLINLLSQYQFTVEESTPLDVEVALDPELMGQIFENLLADYNPETRENARKNTGSYYTPRHIVDYMVTESLKLLLKQALSSEGSDGKATEEKLKKLFNGKNEFNSEQTETLIKRIDGLRILDPAVGSGAFPMGILQRLVGLLEVLDPKNQQFKKRQLDKAKEIEDADIRKRTMDDIEDAFSEENDYNNYARKLYLIKNVIFGVDIQPIAIHIAKLRFFISLAIEQGFDKRARGGNYGIRALPNMEIKFVSADSLIPLSGVSSKQLTFGDDKLAELKEQLFEVRSNYFHATAEDQKEECRRKDKLIRQEIEKELRKNDSYSTKEKGSNVRNSAEKIRLWNPYNQTSTAGWFNSEYIFGIEGFDLVIGNPPYIQLQKDSGALAKKYGDYNFKTFIASGDIYCLFYEKSYELLKQNGICSFITSNKWLRAKYGEKLRDYLVAQIKPLALLDLGPGVFKNATVDTNILFYQKAGINEIHTLPSDTVKNKRIKPISELSQIPMPERGATWVILSRIEREIMEKINRVGLPLKEWDIYIYYGIKTGCNEAFIINNETKEALIKEDPKSSEIIKPLLRGRDIDRYKVSWKNLWLIDAHNGYADIPPINVEDYKAIKKHLDKFYPKLEKKQDKGSTPYNLRNCDYYAEFERDKIVYREISKSLNATYIEAREPSIFVNNKLYIITGESLKYLLACLNSKVMSFMLNNANFGGGKGRGFLGDISVPQITQSKKQPIIDLVNKILDTKAVSPNADTMYMEAEIERLVYQLYGLTNSEIRAIERYN